MTASDQPILISIAQMHIAQADPDANLEKARIFAAEARRRSALLLCLPEMWTTGFHWTRNRSIAGRFRGDLDRIAAIARNHHLWLSGSVAMPETEGRISNALVLTSPQGEHVAVYRKAHLFRPFAEHEHLKAGDERVIFAAPWGPTALTVCFDLRFPELYRAYAVAGATAAFCPAAWPHPRLEHWRTLLRARAIENQMFIIGSNQVGTESFTDTAASYCGHSTVIDPWGNILAEAGEEEDLLTAAITPAEAARAREKFPILPHCRPELYRS